METPVILGAKSLASSKMVQCWDQSDEAFSKHLRIAFATTAIGEIRAETCKYGYLLLIETYKNVKILKFSKYCT